MKKMHIISNSHLDREHRHEFQETRLMMVAMLDDVIDIMENDPEYKYFTLDGQAIVLDDYLEIHPENEGRLSALIGARRILIGPWYSLVDCYSVNPESIIRNLLIGDRACRRFGKPMNVGYSIFSFGQMAQLPQVYAGFGIHDIVFYKGADAKKFPNSEFLWRSPDGTTAFTTRLGKEKRWNFFFDFDIPVILGGDAKKPGWQSKFTYNTRLFHLSDDNFRNQYSTELKPDRYIRKEKILPAIDTVVSLLDETLSEHVLAAFDGTDFTSPLKEIPQVINMVNELKKGELELVHSTPEKYFEEVKADIDKSKLIEYEGEMRFGPVNHVHSETMGTNTEIKQAIWNAENKIINILEPMTAMLYSVGVQSDKLAMRAMWKKLLSAEAHDSIHGSGDPKIKTDNINRLEQVNAMADSLIRRSAEALCREIRFDRNEIHIVALNTLPYARNEILRLTIDFPAEDLTEDFIIYDEDGNRVDYYPLAKYDFNLAMIERTNRPKSVYSDRREIVAELRNIPPMGYKSFTVISKKGSSATSTNPFPTGVFPYAPIARSGNVLDNGLLRITLKNGYIDVYDYETGHLSEGVNSFTSTGSNGDFWVHREPYYNTSVTSKYCRTKIEITENSALRATCRMTAFMDIPVGLNENRTRRLDETRTVKIKSEITLKKDSKRIDFKTYFDNQCRDQLFTVAFPTGINTETADWEAPFEIRKRDTDNFTNDNLKKGPELERQAMQGYIDVNDGKKGMAIFTKGIREAGTVNVSGTVINLTLFRSCSNTFPIHNDLLIGFENETSQCLGRQCFEYSVMFHSCDKNILMESRIYQTDILACEIGMGNYGALPEYKKFLDIKSGKTAVSAFKLSEEGNGAILRIYNPYGDSVKESIVFSEPVSEVLLCDFNEIPYEKAEIQNNGVKLEIGPYKIVTLKYSLKHKS